MCESCRDYSDHKCVVFFSLWNIVWGAFFTLAGVGAIFEMQADKKDDIGTEILIYMTVALAPLYLVSGILIFFGDKNDSKIVFKIGLILSNPLPILLIATIFMPIVHFIALMRLCKYSRERWG